jgi:hypothetical protein
MSKLLEKISMVLEESRNLENCNMIKMYVSRIITPTKGEKIAKPK